MNKRTAILTIGILVAIIVGSFLFSSGGTDEQKTLAGKTGLMDAGIANKDFVPVTHYYVDGTHTFSGKIMLPTPCHQLFSDVRIAESFPEQVTIDFTFSNKAEMCAQVITPEPFSVSFQASENAIVRMVMNEKEMKYRIVSEKGTGMLSTELKDSTTSSTLKSGVGTTTKKGRLGY
jgi:hypothetical protein